MNRYSPSKIKTYESCKLKFHLHYLKEIKIQKFSADTEFGSFFHEAAEHWDGNKEKILEILKKYKIIGEFKGLAAPTFKNYIRFHKKYDKYKLEREQDFELKNDDIWLYGIIDRIMHREKDKVVCDYKTAKNPNRERHMFQMRFYNYMVSTKRDVSPDSIKGMIYYPRIDHEDKFLFTNPEIKQFGKELKNKVDEIETNKEWDASPGYHCRWCGFAGTQYCRGK